MMWVANGWEGEATPAPALSVAPFCPADIIVQLNASTARLDLPLERRLVQSILSRLETDTSNDVHTISVKCLTLLITRVTDSSVAEVTNRLCTHVLSGRSELRDVYGIGLKALIEAVPAAQVAGVSDAAFRHLLAGMVRVVCAAPRGGCVREPAWPPAQQMLARVPTSPRVRWQSR